MAQHERRADGAHDQAAQRAALTPEQQGSLETLEQLGWTLRFVRRPLFRDPVPVAFENNGSRWVAIEPDGSLNETPDFQIRE